MSPPVEDPYIACPMSEPTTTTAFEHHVNTTYHVLLNEEDTLSLELIEATDKTPERFDGEQFSLIFKGPTDPFLPQQICPMNHEVLGRLDLFLVPIDQQEDGFLYEAFFNRAAE